MILGNRVTVGTGATPLWTDPPGGSAGRRKRVTIQNTSASATYIGTSAVTTSAYGWNVAATSGVVSFEVDKGDMLYGVAGANNIVNVLVVDI